VLLIDDDKQMVKYKNAPTALSPGWRFYVDGNHMKIDIVRHTKIIK
jgi:hypothetical protein